jgi:Effector-associated domain 7/Trypsin-like peptidase domain
MDVVEPLIELLRACTVKITAARGYGTGFFVAPGYILTCAHVVKDARDVQIGWREQQLSTQVLALHTGNVTGSSVDYPDLALLHAVDLDDCDHPCALLDESMLLEDPLYSFGYPDLNNYPNGSPVTFRSEGWLGGDPLLLKLKDGQARLGLSGAPLLNLRTRQVCGVVKRTRGSESNLGAYAVPVTTIWHVFPELRVQQKTFHTHDPRWYSSMRFFSNASLTSAPSNKATYHTAAIRRLLREALTDQELEDLCMDYFPDIYNQFSLGMDKHQKTHRLLEYCNRRNQLPYLLERIYQINPEKYVEYINKIL